MSTCVNVTGGVGVRRHLMMMMMMIGVGLCVVQPSAAAAALPRTPPTILCSVTAEAGDTFRYQLSRPLDAPPGCVQGWEDENRMAIVNNKGFDKKLVQSRTNRSIVTTSCRDYLHYTEDCSGKWNESHCRVDCKTLSEQPAATSPPVAPPETWCRDRMTCGLGIGFGILGVVIVLGLIIWCIYSVWMKHMD